MTKSNKKPNNFFEKSFYAFYGIVGLTAIYAFSYHTVTRSNLQIANERDLQISVINPLNVDELDSTNKDSVSNFISQNTTSTNPNIIDTEISKKVLDKLGRKETSEYVIVIKEDGSLNLNSLEISTGDSVTFYNSSSAIIDIKGLSGWGASDIKPDSFFTQIFYPTQTFEYTVKPYETNGKIEVHTP